MDEQNYQVTPDLFDDGDPGGGGQSGDTQGLSDVASADSESVEELAEAGQSYEADMIRGLEDAADHPEQPVPRRDEYDQQEL